MDSRYAGMTNCSNNVFVGNARREIENRTGKNVIFEKNARDLKLLN